MTLGEFAHAALAHERVRVQTRGGLLRWEVDGRLLARQLDADTVVVRCDFEVREQLVQRHPETFTVQPRFEAHQMVVVELATARPEAVTRAVRAAWELQRKHG